MVCMRSSLEQLESFSRAAMVDSHGLRRMQQETSESSSTWSDETNKILGTAFLVRLAFENGDLSALWTQLYERSLNTLTAPAALLDMSVILLVSGQREISLLTQKNALQMRKDFYKLCGEGDGIRVLALMAPGDLMSNTPVDFLLEGSNFSLIQYFVDENTTELNELPEHDIAFMAIGESFENSQILDNISRILKNWNGPILNNSPEIIQGLTRDGVSLMFSNSSEIVSPVTVKIRRDEVVHLTSGLVRLDSNSSKPLLPLIIRPVGTHAGIGMEKIESLENLNDYIESKTDEYFYLCPYINYKNEDYLFRKYRIAFINRQPYPSHLAISKNWMIHYLNADMDKHPERRAEEESWFKNFQLFAQKHTSRFAELCAKIDLDYFVIDCAFMEDGRLLLFEVDVGMIVHDMDPVDLYPYKKPEMANLFSAFQSMLQKESKKQTGVMPDFLPLPQKGFKRI